MKVEPVAWMYQERKGKPFASTVPPESHDPNELSEHEVTVKPLYAIPPGYALVPVEPTEAMLIAARDWSYGQYGKPIGNHAANCCYKAMLTAAKGE